jgi:hypothetical protein
MRASQQNRCAICGREFGRPQVDHDHVTGKVRALLCGQCNTGLGQFKESEATLRSAIDYLRRHRQNPVEGGDTTC